MPHFTPTGPDRRAFLKTAALAGVAMPLPMLDAKATVTEQLAGLEPNHGVLLGRAEVDGEFNDTARRYDLHKTGPRGRDFTIKMCWAPERGRALFCGANHGVPHRLNDVWEFDLPSLSWVMLYAPDLPRGYRDLGKDTSDVEFRDGLLITKRGGPAVVGHTWWGLTYDPRHEALLFMNTWGTDRKKMAEMLGGDPEAAYLGPPLWAFYPAERRWKAFKADKPYPVAIYGGLLEYVPELNGSVWHANNWQMRATWLHDYETGTWEKLDANADAKSFEQQSPQPEQIGYHDPVRKLLVVQRLHDTFHFDTAKLEWTKVLAGDPDDGRSPYGHDARSVFHHDPVSGHGLLVQFQTDDVWAYDPDGPTWTKLDPKGDPMPTGRKRLAYVDAKMGVLVVIESTTVWAYRYRSARFR